MPPDVIRPDSGFEPPSGCAGGADLIAVECAQTKQGVK
jgi:hypothetical protein